MDHRVAEYLVDAEVSIGNYVLTGGELPAAVIIDSITRLLPGVLGNEESLSEESFSMGNAQSALSDLNISAGSASQLPTIEYPQYTRPAEFITAEGETWKVPEILLSGHHAKIQDWRKSKQ